MEIEITKMIVTFINFIIIAIIIAMIIGIIKGIKVHRNFINRSKQMDKKLDNILDELGKRKND